MHKNKVHIPYGHRLGFTNIKLRLRVVTMLHVTLHEIKDPCATLNAQLSISSQSFVYRSQTIHYLQP